MERVIVKDVIEKLTPGDAVEFIGYRETMTVARSDREVLRVDGIMMDLNQATNWIMTLRPIAVIGNEGEA